LAGAGDVDPVILQACDAIGAWLREHDQVMSTSAREVYQPNRASAADDEHCVDIAFP
jgi:hypothetical protein